MSEKWYTFCYLKILRFITNLCYLVWKTSKLFQCFWYVVFLIKKSPFLIKVCIKKDISYKGYKNMKNINITYFSQNPPTPTILKNKSHNRVIKVGWGGGWGFLYGILFMFNNQHQVLQAWNPTFCKIYYKIPFRVSQNYINLWVLTFCMFHHNKYSYMHTMDIIINNDHK